MIPRPHEDPAPIVRRCGACSRPAEQHRGGPPPGCPGWDGERSFDGPWGWRESEGVELAEHYRDVVTAPAKLTAADEEKLAALLGRA